MTSRVDRILNTYMHIPESAVAFIEFSYLNKTMKRYYLRIVQERIARFIRVSD